MKKLVFSILASAVLAIPVCAQSVTVVADVPFGFVAGDATMPAGQYTVGVSAASVTVALAGPGLQTHFLISNSDYSEPSSERPELIFHQYGNQYFLEEIRTPTGSRELPMSHMEIEVKKTASAGSASEKIVLAMR